MPRAAALLIPVVDDGGEAAVILTKRSATMPSHRDDWVFPGGGLDATDISHAEAARREAAEELGVDPDTIEIIGQLDTRGPIMTGYLIETYVAVLSPRASCTRPARGRRGHLGTARRAARRRLPRPDPPGHDPGPPAARSPVDAMSLQRSAALPVREGEHLWGMQAEMLFELLDHLDRRGGATTSEAA